MSNQKSGRESLRIQADRAELLERIARAAPEDGPFQPLEGVNLYRASSPTEILHIVYTPALCILAQGSKEVFVGQHHYRYDPYNFLLATMELPVKSQIVEASRDHPYLSLRLNLDATLVSSVMVEAGHPPAPNHADESAFAVSPMNGSLLDAVVRLARLFDTPGEARMLAPLIKREIVFKLLKSEKGSRLRHTAVLGGQNHRITKAVQWLHSDFDQPLRINTIAEGLNMSVSGFHQHFKAVTGMSPLQFQKHLRLQEARRLMLAKDVDAATAGYQVGYNDASHFNREYKKFFGQPPMQDVARLREMAS